MTDKQKSEIINEIIELVTKLAFEKTESTPTTSETASNRLEMLTIKECTEIIKGLSEHTVRKLVAQNKVKSIRTGEGKRGKILVNKADLIAYFEK